MHLEEIFDVFYLKKVLSCHSSLLLDNKAHYNCYLGTLDVSLFCFRLTLMFPSTPSLGNCLDSLTGKRSLFPSVKFLRNNFLLAMWLFCLEFLQNPETLFRVGTVTSP